MPERHGVVSWPGLLSPRAATYTVSHGISPGVCVITANPQAGPPAMRGNLVLSDGFSTITIPDCRLDRLDVTQGSDGLTWQLTILDRRWRWRELGQVSGAYNQPDPHGLLYPWSVRTPRQLCELCLRAMGETRYTIDVPNVAFPPCNWDYTTPAAALQSLAEALGCRVIYRLDTDSVLVCPLGKGAALPPGSISAEAPGLDLPERPDRITLVGAPIRYQARFRLQAVGKDWDGLYRPIDALTYRPVDPPDPASPWRYAFGPGFPNLPETDRLTRLQAIELAKESVYRCYQLVNIDPGTGRTPLTVPGYGPLRERWQVLLEDTKVEQIQPHAPDERILDDEGARLIKHYYDGFRRDVPAECYGSHFLGSTGLLQGADGTENTASTSKIYVPFSIDPVFQVITFSDYVYRLRDGGGVEPAEVVLETGCLLRDADTNQVLRYNRSLVFPEPHSGGPDAYVQHEDVQLNVIGRYDVVGAGGTARHKLRGLQFVSGQGFSVADTIARSQHYLLGAAAKYQLTGALNRTYNGLVAIPLDGAVQQVTWSVGEPSGAVTQASLNTEHAVYVPPYPTRLRAEFAPAPARRQAGAAGGGEKIKSMWKGPENQGEE